MADEELEGDGVLTADEDEEVTMVVEHFELLSTKEKMRKACEGIKLSLKIREKEMQDAGELPVPEDILLLQGNSAEKIAELEKEYDFAGVSLKDCEQAKRWFKTVKPSSSKLYGPIVSAAYRLWLKWNISRSGVEPHGYKGGLIKKREEEMTVSMTVAMAAVRVE